MPTLITGACGFVGLALAEHLLGRGETVVGCDISPPPPAALRAFAALPGRFDMALGDVRDQAQLLQIMRHHAPRRLVALAAITADSRRELAAPASIFDVNVAGVLGAVSAAAACGVERIVHVSSGSVYGASGNGSSLLREDHTPLCPEGLYGISKQAAEAAALRLARLHGMDLVVGRLGTCFGPWESDTGVRDTLSAPLQVLQLARRCEPVLLPRAGRRDWLYVRDAAAALAALLDTPKLPASTYNLAAGFEWTIADWCRHVSRRHPDFAWGLAPTQEVANVSFYAPYDRASMCIQRLRGDTGFEPRFDLDMAHEDFQAWNERYGAHGAEEQHA